MTDSIGTYRSPVSPTDLTLTVMGDGSAVVRLSGKNIAKVEDATLAATLFELARAHAPGLDLLDMGPGLGALREKLEALQRLLGEAQTVSMHLADATGKIDELDEKLVLLRGELDGAVHVRDSLSARVAELEQQLREAEAANAVLTNLPVTEG